MVAIEPIEPVKPTTYGLSAGSTVKEKIVKVDENTAIRYRVVEEKIDLAALRQEKTSLEAESAMKEPSQEELIDLGKMQHPFYFPDKETIQQRIQDIDGILAETE